MHTHHRLSERKTLGTAYNLRPRTERVPARALRVGDVVMEGPDHPALITRLSNRYVVRVWCRYVWQPPHEAAWPMGEYHPNHAFDRAHPNEY